MSGTDELTAFLLARYDEAERDAQSVHLSDCDCVLDRSAGSCDCGYPARVLRDIAARRSIIGAYRDGAAELARQESTGTVDAGVRGGVTALRFVMTALAGKCSDHPDYPAKGLL